MRDNDVSTKRAMVDARVNRAQTEGLADPLEVALQRQGSVK
jgi:hypothetical protein